MPIETKLNIEVMVFDEHSAPRRISIPVDLSRIGNPEDFSQRVRVMNSANVKMWESGQMAGAEWEAYALAREKYLSIQKP